MSLNDSVIETASTQKRNMKELEAKINRMIDDQVGMVARNHKEKAASQIKKISNLENSIGSTIEGKFESANNRADRSDAWILELTNQVTELKLLIENMSP